LADGDIAPLIQDLGAAGAEERIRAATAIFTQGSSLALNSIKSWLSFSSLENLFIRGAAGAPQLTVGIAVNPATFDRIRMANGSPRLADVPPDQDAREFELEFPVGVKLDILTTAQPGGGGAIDRYLQKFGEGVQQIEVLVSDIDRATEILGGQFDIQPIYPSTRPGADGTRVNFFLVPAPDKKKVLIELVEARLGAHG
jgi:hypothetical protein